MQKSMKQGTSHVVKELKLGPSLNKNRQKNTDKPHQCFMTYIKPSFKISSKPCKNHIRINFLFQRSVRPRAYKRWGMTQSGSPEDTYWASSRQLTGQ